MQSYSEQSRIQYFADILILTGLVLLCAMVFGVLSAALATVLFDISYDSFADLLTDTSGTASTGFLKFYNAFSTFGAWVVSAYLLSRIRSFNPNSLWLFKAPPVRFIWVLLPVLFISAVFISAYLLDMNQRLPLPEGLKSAFQSFRTGELLERMLVMNTPADLAVNMVVIALLPALFEEIFFRGTLQPLLSRLFGSHHAGVWIGSLIFALIHLNIMQLIPMMFLALVLGYLFHYSGSILPSITIHFLNNALAVTAYYYQESSEMARKIVNDSLAPEMWMFILFLAVLVTIFVFLIQQRKLQGNE